MTDVRLEPQEQVVLDAIRAAGAVGITPAALLARLDETPIDMGKTRKDGKVYYRAPSQKIAMIRRKLGRSAISTIIANGTTRYFIGEL